MSKEAVITRIAPSPTGWFHIGTARTALFNYLFTKKHGGKFYWRIDDTDQERSTPEFEADIIAGLTNLGLTHDGLFHQSDNTTLYQQKINQLIESGQAYVSQEAVLKDGDRDSVIRFKNPGTVVTFIDLILGEIAIDVSDLGDFIIAKDQNTPLYHLASVIDDLELGITHVIRGADHLSNTPRQILMIEALGGTRPQYAHIPLILAPDRSKLSKRFGAVAIKQYLEAGYTKEALINFMVLLGWSPQADTREVTATNQEIFSLTELIERFDLSAVQKSGAIFNVEKLNWLNHQYLSKYSDQELVAYLEPELTKKINLEPTRLVILAKALLDRAPNKQEALDSLQGPEFAYLFQTPTLNLELLKNPTHLPMVVEKLTGLNDQEFTPENIKEAIWDFATEVGRGEVLWPMRVALTGLPKSLDPFTVAALLGKNETLKRLDINSS